MESLTFEQLPSAIVKLARKLEAIEDLLIRQTQEPKNQTDNLLTVAETAAFLKLSIPTIYSKVSRCELPNMKRGKRLYFSSQELLEYLKQGRRKTNMEIAAEAETYLQNKKSSKP